MTSFGGMDLETRHRYSRIQLRETFLPIDPSPPHPDNNIQLKLDHGVILRKNSYVKTEEQRKILFSLLRNYERHTHKIYALTDASYQIVVEHCGYREPLTPSVHEDRFTVPLPQYLAVQARLEAERVRSQGYGTIPSVTSQPYPASRPSGSQDTRSDYHSYGSYQHSSAANARKKSRPSGHSSGASPDDLSPSAQVVLVLIFAAIFACGVAGVYWFLKNFISWASEGIKHGKRHCVEGFKRVDWQQVAKAFGSFSWRVMVTLAKVVKCVVVGVARAVAWGAKGAWRLAMDWAMENEKGRLGHRLEHFFPHA
ncbi:hypothetical protein N0V85_009281 [Neurospora sp. IMI 360204]|nr:hypothetical protein N0V85_009281 [Neurospora sp. IMI 360204]